MDVILTKMMDLFTNLPLILAVALFIGIVALVKLLLSPERGLERRSSVDRRRGGNMPPLPFYDKNDKLVTEDRRECRVDRRKRAFVITSEHKRA